LPPSGFFVRSRRMWRAQRTALIMKNANGAVRSSLRPCIIDSGDPCRNDGSLARMELAECGASVAPLSRTPQAASGLLAMGLINLVTMLQFTNSIRVGDQTMSRVIRINDDLYTRLESLANGFDTPSNVIERLLNFYIKGNTGGYQEETSGELVPANSLEIIYFPDGEEAFKQELLKQKFAYVKLFKTDSSKEIKEWNASRFSPSSSVNGNLRAGFLRNWKGKGIYKAEIAIDKSNFS
jgi:hypothetical protein